MSPSDRWPALPLNEWRDTYRTLHMWTQVAGKIRMAVTPPLNHWWHVTLYVNSRGLTTGPSPYPGGLFEIQFDFRKHALDISTSAGPGASRPLRDGQSVAEFYSGIQESLSELGIRRQSISSRRRSPTPRRSTATPAIIPTMPNTRIGSGRSWSPAPR